MLPPKITLEAKLEGVDGGETHIESHYDERNDEIGDCVDQWRSDEHMIALFGSPHFVVFCG